MNNDQQRPGHAIWDAPYRPFFAFGFFFGILVISMWVLQLLANAGIEGVPLLPDPLTALEHAHAMLWGVWGSFAFGFSLTAHPRQSGTEPPSRGRVQALWCTFALGQALTLASALGTPALAMPGRVLELLAYLWLAAFCVRATTERTRASGFSIHSAVFSFAMCGGALTLALHGFGPESLAWASVHTALWGWLVTLVAVFASSLLPRFTQMSAPGGQGASGGRWFLHGFVVLAWVLPGLRQSLGGGAFAIGNSVWFLWCAREWLRWKPAAGMRVPLILPMHLGWLWLLFSLAVAALRPFEAALHLGAINPTHLVTLGCLGSFIFAVSSRVTQAHGGAPPTLDRWGLCALVFLEAGAALRVFGGSFANPWIAYAGAGALVIAAMVVWLARYGKLLVAASR